MSFTYRQRLNPFVKVNQRKSKKYKTKVFMGSCVYPSALGLDSEVQLTRIHQKHSVVIMQVRAVWTILYTFQIHFIGFSKAFLWGMQIKLIED